MMPDLIPKLLRLAAQWESEIREGRRVSANLDFIYGHVATFGVRVSTCMQYEDGFAATLDGVTGTGSTRAEALCALAAELEARE